MMHEDELRRVLQDLEAPDGVSASQLSEQVIRRGRTIKRQQTALTAMVIAGIAASAIGLANMLPGQQNAVPAQQVPITQRIGDAGRRRRCHQRESARRGIARGQHAKQDARRIRAGQPAVRGNQRAGAQAPSARTTASRAPTS